MGAETFARGRKRVDDEAARAFGASRSAMATHATLMETLARAVRASAARAGAEAADEDDAGRRRGNEGETKTNEDARRRASDGGAVRRAIGSGFATVVTKKRSRRAERAGKASETRTALGAPLGESKASRDATGGALTAARLRARLAVVSRGMARGMRVRADVGKVLAAAARGAREGRRETSDGAPRARARGRRHAVDVVAVESIGFESAHRGGDSRGDGRGDRLIRDAKRGVRARRDPRGALRYLFLIETKF